MCHEAEANFFLLFTVTMCEKCAAFACFNFELSLSPRLRLIIVWPHAHVHVGCGRRAIKSSSLSCA
jgi:hypothetical protein